MVEQKKKREEINFMNDAMFKAIFRSEESRVVVASFLSAITKIPKEKFINAHFVGGELTKKNINEKGKTADVIVKVEDGLKIIVEMNQTDNHNPLRKNNAYAYTSYIETKKEREWIYPKIILINLNNFNHYKVDYPIQEFRLRDQYGVIDDTLDLLRYDLILENFNKLEYNIIEEEKETLTKFAQLLLTKSLLKLHELYEGDSDYMDMINKAEDLIEDEDFIGYYDYEERRQQDMIDSKNNGIKQGIEQGKIEMAKKLYEQGIDIKTISNCSNIAEEKLKEYLDIKS